MGCWSAWSIKCVAESGSPVVELRPAVAWWREGGVHSGVILLGPGWPDVHASLTAGPSASLLAWPGSHLVGADVQKRQAQ